jgi:hypothetical protein
LLTAVLLSTNSNATTYTYGFEDSNSTTPIFAGTNEQNINFGAITFSGGTVLRDATFFPAHKNYFPNNLFAYGSSSLSDNLLAGNYKTISLSVLPNFHASAISFTLFNGENFIQDYTVEALNGSTPIWSNGPLNNPKQIKLQPNNNTENGSNASPIGVGSFQKINIDNLTNDITNINITYYNPPPVSDTATNPTGITDTTITNTQDWDFLIDDVSISGAGVFNISPVPEPENYAMILVGLSLMRFVCRRRKSM